MIHDAAHLKLPGTLKADLCVIGSGPGGATAATIAAEAGLRVVVIEAGALVTPAQMNQREEDMMPRLLWEAGGRTTADRAVRILQGHGVGGSSLHNINLCKRIPTPILRRSQAKRGLKYLPLERWHTLYTEVERLLAVSAVPPERWNRHNQLLQKGCEVLGWKGGGLSHNRTGCIGSGFCELGCAYDAKNNALKVFIPRLMAAGGTVLTHCQAVHLLHRKGAVYGVSAMALDPDTLQPIGKITIEAAKVCVSASATGTPALLHRSQIPHPEGSTGDTLRVHPAVIVAGEFEEPVHAWRGIPQTYECTEWLDLEHERNRTWIVPVFGHPMSVATMMPDHGSVHRDLMHRFSHMAAFTAMLHDHTPGKVRPNGPLGVEIDLWPHAADRTELMKGLERCARLLFAAGAKRLIVPGSPTRVLEKGDDVSVLAQISLERGAIDISAVHPMASVPMGDNPKTAAVDSRGKHHHLEGLWISDGSLFPSSIGVPPQLSIYALGLHVGRAIVEG